jgi:hypothetical protein
VDIAAHLAHNMFHLLAEGSVVFSTVGSLAGITPPTDAPALASSGVILALQLILLALGVLGSGYTVYRIARSRYADAARRRVTMAPYLALLGILTVMNTYLFLLPMAHRL